MIRLLLVLNAGIFLVGYVFAQSEPVDRASAAYQSGDYNTAINIYESLLVNGVQDGAIFYNLGNAYYQSGQLGRALLNYRRAQNLIPRDTDLNINIAIIRSRRLDVQGDETGLLESLSVLTSGLLTMTELAWFAFALWTLWFGLLCLAILRERWRDTLRVPLIIFGAVALVGLVLLGSRWYVTASAPSAVVLVSTVQVMSGPGEDYLEIFELHEAAELRLLETNAGWVRFALADGRQGWIPRQSVEVV